MKTKSKPFPALTHFFTSFTLVLFAGYFVYYLLCVRFVNTRLGIIPISTRSFISLIEVTVNENEAVSLNGKPVNEADLADEVNREIDKLPPNLRVVTITAPKGIGYGKVMRVVDIVKGTRAIRITLAGSP